MAFTLVQTVTDKVTKTTRVTDLGRTQRQTGQPFGLLLALTITL